MINFVLSINRLSPYEINTSVTQVNRSYGQFVLVFLSNQNLVVGVQNCINFFIRYLVIYLKLQTEINLNQNVFENIKIWWQKYSVFPSKEEKQTDIVLILQNNSRFGTLCKFVLRIFLV